MTTNKNSRRYRATAAARVAEAAPSESVGQTQVALQRRLRHMAVEVEHLQNEIAAVEALVAPATATAEKLAPQRTPARPGEKWTPTPTPQPWLEARSA